MPEAAEETQEVWKQAREQEKISDVPSPFPLLFQLFLTISGTKSGHPGRDGGEASWLRMLAEAQCAQSLWRAGLGEAKTDGQVLVAHSVSWKQAEQQDLLTLYTQHIKSSSRRGAIWKWFSDRNSSAINS